MRTISAVVAVARQVVACGSACRPTKPAGARAVPRLGLLAASFALAVVVAPASAAEAGQAGVVIDADDIGGVVTGPDGPEAGVWVIAETSDLPTLFNRIVVTDGDGRYVLPDLPGATYDVWVRGYGLVDSAKVQATPGTALDLTAVVAPDAAAAAQYYPAGHWLSLIEVPGRDEFPGTGPDGNGISPNVRSQAEWMRTVKSGGCTACHALGNKATREVPPELGEFDSMIAALGAAHPVGTGGRLDVERARSDRAPPGARDVRRLDGPDPRR